MINYTTLSLDLYFFWRKLSRNFFFLSFSFFIYLCRSMFSFSNHRIQQTTAHTETTRHQLTHHLPYLLFKKSHQNIMPLLLCSQRILRSRMLLGVLMVAFFNCQVSANSEGECIKVSVLSSSSSCLHSSN